MRLTEFTKLFVHCRTECVFCPQRPPPDGDRFFQTLKHGRVNVQALLLYCSVTAYLHQQVALPPYCDSYQESPWHGGFPDRHFVSRRKWVYNRYTTPDELSKPRRIQCCVLLLRRSVAHRLRGLSNARIPWATRKLCFLILLAGYVDPDKVLRRYHGLDLEVKGFVEGAKGSFKCSLSLACEVCVYANFLRCNCLYKLCYPPQFEVSTTHGAYWWSERRCNTCCTSERSSCEHRA